MGDGAWVCFILDLLIQAILALILINGVDIRKAILYFCWF